MRIWLLSLFSAVFLAVSVVASAAPWPQGLPVHRFAPSVVASSVPADAGRQCRRAVIAAGREAGIPPHIMSAIARVESGRPAADGSVQPWPWSINVEGADHVYDTKAEVITAVRQFQAQGARSIDVGCMQVNLLHHPTAFASLDQAFDPVINARYAARFLSELYAQSHAWPKAIADYHSATPALGEAYARQVLAVLGAETQADLRDGGAGSTLADHSAPIAGEPGQAGAIMLGNHAQAARILPGPALGRGLDAYRAAPVRVAGR